MTTDGLYVSAIMLIPFVLFAALFLAAAYGVVRLAVSHELKNTSTISSRRKRSGNARQPPSYSASSAAALALSHMSLSSLTERSSSETPPSNAASSISSQR